MVGEGLERNNLLDPNSRSVCFLVEKSLLSVLSLLRKDLVDGEMHKRKIIHTCLLAVLFLDLCV